MLHILNLPHCYSTLMTCLSAFFLHYNQRVRFEMILTSNYMDHCILDQVQKNLYYLICQCIEAFKEPSRSISNVVGAMRILEEINHSFLKDDAWNKSHKTYNYSSGTHLRSHKIFIQLHFWYLVVKDISRIIKTHE